MAHAGKVISNTVMAGTVKFIKTAADTGGGLLEMEATYKSTSRVKSVPILPVKASTFSATYRTASLVPLGVKKHESFGKYVRRSTLRPFLRLFMDWPRMAK